MLKRRRLDAESVTLSAPIPKNIETYSSFRPLLFLAGARQAFFNDVANCLELQYPIGFQPEKFRSLDPPRAVADFFFGDILALGIVKSSGLFIVVKPRRLSLPR